MSDNYKEELLAAVGRPGFRMLILSGGRQSEKKVRIRPIETKRGLSLQIVRSNGQTLTLSRNEAQVEIGKLLMMPFAHIHLQAAERDVHVRITRKGKVLISQAAPSSDRTPDLSHDREKKRILTGPDDFLAAIGIQNERGEVRPSMHAKFRQVNAFLEIVEPLLRGISLERPIRMLDCGCGSAHLTFAVFHYARHVLKLDVRMTGIDRNPAIIEKSKELSEQLGWDELQFEAVSIDSYNPADAPDFVFSLHACDTATDEAIAQGVRWGSRGIIAAPCCQHELHRQLREPAFEAVLRHGILRERLADLLTDALRAAILNMLGYRAEVVEFVAPEYTPKNLIIRAELGTEPGRAEALRRYTELRDYWKVRPALEQMLEEQLRPWLK